MVSIRVYEVLRIIESKPLFWEDHYIRFINSINGASLNISISKKEYRNELFNCIKKNNLKNGNVKISCICFHDDRFSVVSEIIPHKYPTKSDYKDGVKTKSANITRYNPSLKIWNNDLRSFADDLIEKHNVYEIIYLNEHNCLTEGSRSNLFFIKDNFLFSPPEKEILSGITRKYIIECVKQIDGFTYQEKNISYYEIKNFDAAFISGTSPKVLPVKTIDSFDFDVNNSYLRAIMQCYDNQIAKYLQE
jgi:branched-chain amino acid aminotransferase